MNNKEETFKEGLNSFPPKKEEKLTTEADGYELVRFDYELDSNGPEYYYVKKDRFKRPETIDHDLDSDSEPDL